MSATTRLPNHQAQSLTSLKERLKLSSSSFTWVWIFCRLLKTRNDWYVCVPNPDDKIRPTTELQQLFLHSNFCWNSPRCRYYAVVNPFPHPLSCPPPMSTQHLSLSSSAACTGCCSWTGRFFYFWKKDDQLNLISLSLERNYPSPVNPKPNAVIKIW